MNKEKLWVLVGLSALVAIRAGAEEMTVASKLAVTPEEMTYVTIVPAPPDVTSVLLVGDLQKPGVYVLRNKFPPNSRIAAHSHDQWRVMTVMEGTLYFAYGNSVEIQQLKEFGPGSVIIEPPNEPHYFITKEDGAVLQFVAEGPLKSSFPNGGPSTTQNVPTPAGPSEPLNRL